MSSESEQKNAQHICYVFKNFLSTWNFFVLTWDFGDQELGNLRKGEWQHCLFMSRFILCQICIYANFDGLYTNIIVHVIPVLFLPL